VPGWQTGAKALCLYSQSPQACNGSSILGNRPVRSGTYYEGWLDDKLTEKVLQLHSQETVTCYGSQRPTKASGCTAEEKHCQVEYSVAEKESKVLPVRITVNHDTI